MGLKSLLERLHAAGPDTPATPEKNAVYQQECSIHAGCTPDTPDTPPFRVSETAAVPGPAHDRWCWPFSSAMNGPELGRFTARLARFTDNGLPLADAEALAEKLVIRDREGDDRRLCLECANLCSRRCSAWRRAAVGGPALPTALLALPQRCAAFDAGRAKEDVAAHTPRT